MAWTCVQPLNHPLNYLVQKKICFSYCTSLVGVRSPLTKKRGFGRRLRVIIKNGLSYWSIELVQSGIWHIVGVFQNV